MPRFRFAAATAILTIALFSLQAYATGNVLLPSDDDSPPPTSSDQPDKPAVKNQPAEEEPALPALDPETQAPPPPSDYTPVPAASMMPPMSMSMPPAPPAVKPQIIQIPATSPQATTLDSQLPGKFAVTIGKYIWGPADMNSIQSTLGIRPDLITQHCRLSANGMLRSNGVPGVFPYEVGAAASTKVPYAGDKLTGISVRLHALCDQAPLPANARYIMQMGEKYSVNLTPLNCPPPPEKAKRLTIRYAGNGDGECVYE